MKNLIKEINDSFPQKEGGFNCAVFFHHDKNGDLKTMSPLVMPSAGEQMDIRLIVKRLLTYADACKNMADQMINKSLPKN